MRQLRVHRPVLGVLPRAGRLIQVVATPRYSVEGGNFERAGLDTSKPRSASQLLTLCAGPRRANDWPKPHIEHFFIRGQLPTSQFWRPSLVEKAVMGCSATGFPEVNRLHLKGLRSLACPSVTKQILQANHARLVSLINRLITPSYLAPTSYQFCSNDDATCHKYTKNY